MAFGFEGLYKALDRRAPRAGRPRSATTHTQLRAFTAGSKAARKDVNAFRYQPRLPGWSGRDQRRRGGLF